MLSIWHNKRKLARAPIHVSAEVASTLAKYRGTILQISEGGVFLQMDGALPPRTSLSASFDLPGFGPQRVVVEVRWSIQPGRLRLDPTVQGMGCQFSSVLPQTKVNIADYIKQMKKTYSQLQFALALSRPPATLPALLKETQLERERDVKKLKEHVSLVLMQLSVN